MHGRLSTAGELIRRIWRRVEPRIVGLAVRQTSLSASALTLCSRRCSKRACHCCVPGRRVKCALRGVRRQRIHGPREHLRDFVGRSPMSVHCAGCGGAGGARRATSRRSPDGSQDLLSGGAAHRRARLRIPQRSLAADRRRRRPGARRSLRLRPWGRRRLWRHLRCGRTGRRPRGLVKPRILRRPSFANLGGADGGGPHFSTAGPSAVVGRGGCVGRWCGRHRRAAGRSCRCRCPLSR
mmetsp:Transcript_77995/g.253051  ORF Transcript_77995/g.253051 Transcript_77995/m.253051 type:complete len:238 (-) Transcript_77995:2250-2963(-)